MLVRKKNNKDSALRALIPLAAYVFFFNPLDVILLIPEVLTSQNPSLLMTSGLEILLLILLIGNIVRCYISKKDLDLYHVINPGQRNSRRYVTGDQIGLPIKFSDLTQTQNKLFEENSYVEIEKLVNKDNLFTDSTKSEAVSTHSDTIQKFNDQNDDSVTDDNDDPFSSFYNKGNK